MMALGTLKHQITPFAPEIPRPDPSYHPGRQVPESLHLQQDEGEIKCVRQAKVLSYTASRRIEWPRMASPAHLDVVVEDDVATASVGRRIVLHLLLGKRGTRRIE